jgi:hypothetical protein
MAANQTVNEPVNYCIFKTDKDSGRREKTSDCGEEDCIHSGAYKKK